MFTEQIEVIELPVSVAEAKLRLRIEHSEDDADLEMMIGAAADLAGGKTRRSVAHTRWRMTLPNGFPKGPVSLPWGPIMDIVSIDYTNPDGNPQQLGDYMLIGDQIIVLDDEWPPHQGKVTVTYDAGFGDQVPFAIQQYILLQVGHWYKNREAASEKALIEAPFTERLLDRFRIVEV
jgi:uncharacterized phiE125 gp8 family phage protein